MSHGRGRTTPTIKPADLEVATGTWQQSGWCRWTPELWYGPGADADAGVGAKCCCWGGSRFSEDCHGQHIQSKYGWNWMTWSRLLYSFWSCYKVNAQFWGTQWCYWWSPIVVKNLNNERCRRVVSERKLSPPSSKATWSWSKSCFIEFWRQKFHSLILGPSKANPDLSRGLRPILSQAWGRQKDGIHLCIGNLHCSSVHFQHPLHYYSQVSQKKKHLEDAHGLFALNTMEWEVWVAYRKN